MTFDQVALGQSASIIVKVDAHAVDAFADLSGDRSAIHVDAAVARESGFRDRVVHGFLIGAYVSQLIGMKLPGATALLLSETLRFQQPVYPGDVLTVTAQVEHRSEATRTIDLAVEVARSGERVVSGSVRVLVRE